MNREFPRVGLGWDLHRMVAGRPLMLAGVEVPYNKGLLGHSDGDVVLHAVIDAMLGAAGLDDIGQVFPDADDRWKDADSRAMVTITRELVARTVALRPVQVDVVVIIEQPKLAPHKAAMRQSLANLLGLDVGDVNIKAKTHERIGEIGRGEAVAAQAVVVLAACPTGGLEQRV